MTVNTLNAESGASTRGPWILACGYCNWTSLDIGIQFDKPTNVSSQLAKLTNGGGWKPLAPLDAEPSSDATPENTNVDSKFSSLKSFLGSQLSASNPLNPLMSPSSERNYSPSNLARIMNLYTGTGPSVKKASSNTSTMRESADTSEGLHVVDRVFESNNVQRLRQQGWSGTTSMAQRAELRQPPRFVDDLIPIPTLLRTKRSKRCRACYHILVKQETKVMSTKYRIKLLASNHIPEISLKPLHPVELDASSDGMIDLDEIIPHKPWQFLLTLKNPMDEPVVVTLATPNFTPGKYKHKVTLLCPQFEIGRNKEVWDEALGSSDIRGHANRPNRESKQNAEYPVSQYEGRFPVAGKVWEKGRNWTTVVLEVVCVEVEGKDEEREEDEDVVEVPVSVRIEYEVEVDVVKEKASKEKEKRDLAYWCVLGVGRIQDVARMSEEKS
ncbi:hypothetical protein MMC12_008022 [Toensbergia leucococca]|nr:hypothetical protein [Toensbergia leucococca]